MANTHGYPNETHCAVGQPHLWATTEGPAPCLRCGWGLAPGTTGHPIASALAAERARIRQELLEWLGTPGDVAYTYVNHRQVNDEIDRICRVAE